MDEGRYTVVRTESRKWWDRSSLGRPDKGGLVLTPTDIIFCHMHRNMSYPKLDWLKEILSDRPELVFESLVNEALRSPGNKVVWHDHFEPMSLSYVTGTNALRWNSNSHPDKGPPDSEVRWFHARSYFHPRELLDWTKEVNEVGRLAEILIVDDDLDVVSYRLQEFSPNGETSKEDLNSRESIRLIEGSSFMSTETQKKLPSYLGGYVIDENQLQRNKDMKAKVYRDLLNRGLFVRSGFKYGVRWRAYASSDFSGHAPWLISQPDALPSNWISACQGSRLASGVGKTMLLPVVQKTVRYLGVLRPPSDARWNLNRRN